MLSDEMMQGASGRIFKYTQVQPYLNEKLASIISEMMSG